MLTIKGELIEYAYNCLEDKYVSEFEDYISCEKHKWACQRLLNDFEKEKTEEWRYYWDEEEAQEIVNWFSYLRHSKGILAGQPIILTTWQKFILCQIYGWRNADTGYKRFNKSFIEVARKQSKSQMQAGVILKEMSVEATKNGEIYECYSAGTKNEQSRIIFQEAVNMLRGSPLATRFNRYKTVIEHIKTGSFLKALSKEDGRKGDGTNPAVLVLDEYHQHQTTEFYDLGLGANTKESLLMIITTAGVDLTYPCFTQEYKYCSNILNPNIDVENDRYFVDICEIDKDDDISVMRNWKKANPLRMTYQEGVEKIKEDYQIATEVPEKKIMFLTKMLNRWVQSKEMSYMDMEKYKKCEVKTKDKKFDWDFLRGRECYIGFDMSAKIDLTSVAIIIPVMVENVAKYYIYSHSFIPNREKLIERIRVDKMPYDSWEIEGYITVTETPIVDQERVIQWFEGFCASKGLIIKQLCFDPANASKMMMDLSSRGYECVEVFQSYKSLNESTCGFREQVYCENVVYEYNPVLNYAMSNAIIVQNNGLIRIDKDSNTKRIDPVASLLAGFKLAQYHEFEFDINKYINEDYINRLYGGANEAN